MTNRNVLVVDDDQNIVDSYREILSPTQPSSGMSQLDSFVHSSSSKEAPPEQRTPFQVKTANQGLDAVLLVVESLAQKAPFAVAFIDIRMPPGINGLETARRIRELDERIHIIIVTAYSDKHIEEIQETLSHDVIFTRKPLAGDEIYQLARNGCLSWEAQQAHLQEQNRLEHQVENLDAMRWYFTDIISCLNEGIIVCSPFGRIRYMNPAAIRMSGYKPWDLTMKGVGILFRQTDVSQLVRRIVETNAKPRHIHKTLVRADRSTLPILMSGTTICSTDGREQSVLLVLNDLTVLKNVTP
ncbi:MAG: response regulator [Magnetococcales bacterium]|nr:response regulator [Magnetococcales bacterium]